MADAVAATALEGLLFGWNKNLDYGRKLLADLSEQQVIAQPAPGVNHPAWVLSHLNLYHPVLVAIARKQPFPDPREHTFGMKSKPETTRSAYPSKDALVQAWVSGHESVAAALREAGPGVLDWETPLERWRPTMPKVGILLPYLMLVHENTHLGQISMWRRVQGLPSV